MELTCHRCGGSLPAGSGESPFCPHCGAPQLYLSLDYQSVETGGDPPPAATTGTVPPPRPDQVDWKMAIRCALAVSAVGGLLIVVAIPVPALTPAGLLWVMCGSLITLGLYQNRRPLAWMDAGLGAKIGLVVGLFLSVGLAIPMAVLGLVKRFGLHTMAGFDGYFEGLVVQMIQSMQKTMQQQSGAPLPAELVQLVHSQEFRAGYMLFVFAFFAVLLLLMSTLGGAFAGLLRMRRKAAA